MSLKSFPQSELPREKALTHGIDKLSNVELLAILLRCGNKNQTVMDLSLDVLKSVGGIENMPSCTYEML